MFGFVFAAFCFFGLVALAATRRRHRGARGFYRFFSRLGATPGQERVLRNAMLDLRDASREALAHTKEARPELASILAESSFDEERVRGWLAARKTELETLEDRFLASLKQVHDVLDDEQRRELSTFVKHGPWLFGRYARGGYHHGHSC